MKSAAKGRPAPDELAGLSPFAREIAGGLQNAIAYVKGRNVRARKTILELPDSAPLYAPAEVRGARQRLGLTQASFARLMNVSVKSVEGWEAGTKKPSPPSRRLIQIVSDRKAMNAMARVANRSVAR